MLTKAPRGTFDILPDDVYKWQYLESVIRDLTRDYAYQEIRTPVFEHTELFERGVGDTTDEVQKEMYTFNDKGNRSITLRPEGTASAARALIEHSLYAKPLPVKLYYNISCYRYEKPQAGRLREFHQFGAEVYGSEGPGIDAELISLATGLLHRLGIHDVQVNLNSIGCPTCRKKYSEALREYFKPHLNELCETCRGRYEKNPLRILDCKSPVCHEIAKGAPMLLDYLCDDCRAHFEELKKTLDETEIPYIVDPTIVRGLDYYTKTVFEITTGLGGAQNVVCGGGRYDGLIEELGGNPMPAMGFAMGLERLLLLLEDRGITIPAPEKLSIFVGSIGDAAEIRARKLVEALRGAGISAEKDHNKRSVKAQMKFADKLGARFTLMLGDSELESGRATVKNMENGEKPEISIDDIEAFRALICK